HPLWLPRRPVAARYHEGCGCTMSTTLDPTESGAQTAAAPVATIPVATTVAPVAPAPVAKRERLLSLDVFRGLTIAGMLLVNNPGTWSAIYPPLEHADWNGWTPTDLIFPYFLFIVGITTYLSLTSRRSRGADDRAIITQILKRGGMIVLVGLLLSGLPYHEFVLRLPFGAQFDSLAPHLGLGHWRGVHCRGAAHHAHVAQAAGGHHRRPALRLLVRHDTRSGPRARGNRRVAAQHEERHARRLARPHGVRHESPLGRLAHLGPRRDSLDHSRDRDLHARRDCRPVDRRAAPAARACGRAVRGGGDRDDGGTHVELVVPHQQEPLDELVRDLHRRHGVRDAGHVHLARGRAGRAMVDQALRHFRCESAGGVHWRGRAVAAHLHAREGTVGGGNDLAAACGV